MRSGTGPGRPTLRPAGPDDVAAVEAAGAVTVAAYASFLRGLDDPYAERLREAASRARDAEVWGVNGCRQSATSCCAAAFA